MSDTSSSRPFRWEAIEKIARLEAEIEDLKDDKRIFLSHINLLADLLTPDQAAKARESLDVRPKIEFLSKTLELKTENAALRDSHAEIYFALQTKEADHTKWPQQIAALRAAAVEVCAIARVWATVWHDKLSLDSIRRFAELEQQILKLGAAAIDAAREEQR